MAIPEDLIAPLVTCMGGDDAGFAIPGIADPGLPGFALAGLGSMLGGMTFILDFIPPDPLNLPSPPSPTIFIDPMLAGIKIPEFAPGVPGDLGEIDFSAIIPGGPVIPATGPNVVGDQSGMINLILAVVATPFTIITGFVTKLLELELPAPPSIEAVAEIFLAGAASVGLDQSLGVIQFAVCFATAIVGVITALLP